MLNTFSRSLIIIWKTTIETWAQDMNGGPGNELGARRAEQFPHLGNYTLPPACIIKICKNLLPVKKIHFTHMQQCDKTIVFTMQE